MNALRKACVLEGLELINATLFNFIFCGFPPHFSCIDIVISGAWLFFINKFPCKSFWNDICNNNKCSHWFQTISHLCTSNNAQKTQTHSKTIETVKARQKSFTTVVRDVTFAFFPPRPLVENFSLYSVSTKTVVWAFGEGKFLKAFILLLMLFKAV